MRGFINRRIKPIQKKTLKQKAQRTSNPRIFNIVKQKRSTPKSDRYDFSTTQSELSEELMPSQTVSVFDIEIPSFFNDFNLNYEIQSKLMQYDKLNHMFDDIEHRDMYLVRKDSLFC